MVGHASDKVQDGVDPPMVGAVAIGLYKVFAKGIFAQKGGAITGVFALEKLQDGEEGIQSAVEFGLGVEFFANLCRVIKDDAIVALEGL